MHCRDVVDPRHDAEAFAQRREMRAIGADIAEIGAADGEEIAVPIERQLGARRQIAALVIGEEAFAAVGEEFHRPAELLHGPGSSPYSAKNVLRVPKMPPMSPHFARHSRCGTPSAPARIPRSRTMPPPVPAQIE